MAEVRQTSIFALPASFMPSPGQGHTHHTHTNSRDPAIFRPFRPLNPARLRWRRPRLHAEELFARAQPAAFVTGTAN